MRNVDVLSQGLLPRLVASSHPDIVVAIAASAGGLAAVSHLLSQLPVKFAAAVLLVQHLDPRYPSFMAQILGRRTNLPVCEAHDGQILESGNVYIAPPDHHLRIADDFTLKLTQTAEVHFVRPSADILFDSVAERFGTHAVAVVLTGSGSDGSDGVVLIKKAGGTVIVQGAAEFDGMPAAAIRTGSADHVVDLASIARTVVQVVDGLAA